MDNLQDGSETTVRQAHNFPVLFGSVDVAICEIVYSLIRGDVILWIREMVVRGLQGVSEATTPLPQNILKSHNQMFGDLLDLYQCDYEDCFLTLASIVN